MPAPRGFRLPILQGVLPIKGSQVPAALIAGLTLAALAVPALPAMESEAKAGRPQKACAARSIPVVR